MTQLGEGVAVEVPAAWKGDDKCVFCGDDHPNKKRDKINPTGWVRKKISGVGGNFAAEKKLLYPNRATPPTAYRSEGHHCVAFSSFIRGASAKPPNPRDYFAPINHYLNEKKYHPNMPNNTIDLPGRKARGDEAPEAQYKQFEIAVAEGFPMQLHIGGHKTDLMLASDVLLQDLYNVMKHPEICDDSDLEKFKDDLLQCVQSQEDFAFRETASVRRPFVCHPDVLPKAERFVKKKRSLPEIRYPKL